MVGKFLKVRCKKCKNEQVIFNKACTKIYCLVCGNEIGEPTGGKIEIKNVKNHHFKVLK